MVISSKISSDRFIWLRVPRTATETYGKVFFSDGKYQHNHNNYYYEIERFGKLPVFSVVRNPYTRFVSSLKFIAQQQYFKGKVGRYNFFIPLDSTETLCNFLVDNLKVLRDIDYTTGYKKVFQTEDLSFVNLFFRPQKNFVGYPPVKLFRYEALQEFNSWIECVLGYDTSNIKIYNSSSEELQHIDFLDSRFVDVTQRLFEEDFKHFGYENI